MKEKWITMKQAATLVGVTDITIKNWINKGLLSFQNNHRCFRVDRNQVVEVAKRKTELCEAIRSVDEALSAYKEERELYEKEAESYRTRKEGLRSIVLDKKKVDSRFDWTMNTLAGLYVGILNTCNNEGESLPERSSDILYKLILGATIDDISQEYSISIERVRQHIRKAVYCVWSISDRLYKANDVKELRACVCELQDELELKTKAIESMEKQLAMLQATDDLDDINQNAYNILEKKLVECNLSGRCLNGLRGTDIYTIRNLIMFHERDMTKFRYMGRKSVNELKDLLESYNLRFGMSEADIEDFLSNDTHYKTICSEKFVEIASMRLTHAIPELAEYRYLYYAGFRTVLDMLKVNDSFTFRHMAALTDRTMAAVVMFMRKNNLCFDTRIRTSDYRKYFLNNKKSDMDDFD